MMMLIFETS